MPRVVVSGVTIGNSVVNEKNVINYHVDKVRGSISIVESALYALYIADLVWFEDVCHI